MAFASPDALLGTLLDARYRIVQHIATGGVGHLYVVEDEQVRGRVKPCFAAKVLRFEHVENAVLQARFAREIQATSKIRDLHVLAVLHHGRLNDSIPFFVTELLTGMDLGDTLELRTWLAPVRAVHIALQITQGLAAAHTVGVVHRDLKPENVFLASVAKVPTTLDAAKVPTTLDAAKVPTTLDAAKVPTTLDAAKVPTTLDAAKVPTTLDAAKVPTTFEQVKLLDFGLAWIDGDPGDAFSSRLSIARTGVGTIEYMAPEQAFGDVGRPAADIYALGIVLYEMLSGAVPFSGSPEQVVHQHVHDNPPPLARGSQELGRVIERALRKDPSRRYESAQAMAQALQDTPEGQRISGLIT